MIKVVDTEISDVKIIEPQIHVDSRGYFLETYNQNEFHKKIGKINFVQDNESFSERGILRGLHIQAKPYEQSKLVRVVRGKIQDIALDVRKNSDTYLKHVSVILSHENKKQIFIPKGFAHGFLVLSEYAIVNYKVDEYYKPDYESTIYYNNPKLKINWKLDQKLILVSKKDQNV